MATETRILRPFRTPQLADDVLQRSVIHVSDSVVTSDGRATLSYDEYLHSPVRLQLGGPDGISSDEISSICDEVEELGASPDGTLLAINLYSSFLKISEYPVVQPLSELNELPGVIDLAVPGNRPRAMRTPFSGCRIELSLVLGEELPAMAGRPWRKGTWLTRHRYFLSCELEYAGFTPMPMNKEKKLELGVSASATRYVTLPLGFNPMTDAASPDVLELWVDEELLAEIASQPKSPISSALQRQLFVDAFSAVTVAVKSDPDFDHLQWSDTADTLLGSMIRGLVGRGTHLSATDQTQKCQEMLRMIRDDHSRFVALVEHHAGLTAAYSKALQE